MIDHLLDIFKVVIGVIIALRLWAYCIDWFDL
jgi:hypothetical protein